MEKSSTRVCFIVNPAANRYRAVRHVDWLNREAKKRWENFEIVISPENQPVSELAADKSSGFSIIVACGGDGTVNQVVNGIAGTNTTLGILPIGSGNDFVKTLYQSTSLQACLDLIYQEKKTRIDLISCKGSCNTWCVNTLGIGLDGWANYYAKKHRLLRGSLIYTLGALRAAFAFRGAKMGLTIDGKIEQKNYLMLTACSGKWEGGGFLISPDADPCSGFIHLVAILKTSVPGTIMHLIRFWLGFSKAKHLKIRRCKSIKIQSEEPVAAHGDGEHLGEDLQCFNISVVPKALEVISK